MREDLYYIEILENEINKTQQTTLLSEWNVFYEFVQKQNSEYFQAYTDGDFERLEQDLLEHRKLRKIFTKELKKINQVSNLATQFVQIYNTYNKLLQNQIRERSFSDEMDMIMCAYKNANEVLNYLYRHPHAQHKIIVADIGIPKSSLTDLLNDLIEIQCVIKAEKGKFSFYDLSMEGKIYLEKKHPNVKKEFIIDVVKKYEFERKQATEKEKFLQKNETLPYQDNQKIYQSFQKDNTNKFSYIGTKNLKQSFFGGLKKEENQKLDRGLFYGWRESEEVI